MKFKHNKKRNTIFIFESLVRELTKSVINKDFSRKKEILSIIKENFSNTTVLGKELEYYKSILESKELKRGFAEKLLQEIKREHSKLNKEDIFKSQSKLIKQINKGLSSDVFMNFVPNYKNLATVYQFLNADMSPKRRVMLEEAIVDFITQTDGPATNKKTPQDSLTLQTFIKKFNSAYKKDLHVEQKDLLNKYVASFADNGIDLKIFLNEEIKRLKNNLTKGLSSEEIKEKSEITDKTKKVLTLMEEYKNKKIDSRMIEQVLKIQSLAREIT